MSRQDADADKQQRQQMNAQCRLQHNVGKEAEVEEYQEVQIAACAYLVLIACYQAVRCADDEQQEQISQSCQFPRLEVEPQGGERHQFPEGLVEQFHLPVEECMSQQKPVGHAPAHQ